MSEVIYADPDSEVSAMCHRNHVERAYLYEQEIPDAQYEPVQQKAKSGPVICIYGKDGKETQEIAPQAFPTVTTPACELVRNDSKEWRAPTIETVKRVLGALVRWGAGAVFLCGVADGLIDTTYGLMLTIVCIGWGLLHLLKVVAHG